MKQSEVFAAIKAAIDSSPRNGYIAELHVQIIKYWHHLHDIKGKTFCEGVGINASFGTEFSKMKKIAPRLINAGLDVSKI